MFKRMRISAKISLGFAISLLLTLVIGLIAIIYMENVGRIINQLATLEIPETAAVVDTERKMWNTHVLSYGFDIQMDDQSRDEWFEAREKAEAAVDKIVPIATALNHAGTVAMARKIGRELKDYQQIGEQYASVVLENKRFVKEMQGHATVTLENLDSYIADQNAGIEAAVDGNAAAEIVDRFARVKSAHEAKEILYDLRVRFLFILDGEAQNNEGFKASLQKLIGILQKVIEESADPVSERRARAALESIQAYGGLAETWLINQKTQQELLARSDKAAFNIIDQTTRAAYKADEDAMEVGARAIELVAKVSRLLIGLLAAAICLGALFAFFIIRSITKPVNWIIKDLNESAEQLAAASGQISSASQSLAEGASQQAASLEETSSSMEQMASMTRQNASNAAQAAGLTRESQKTLETANQSMAELIGSMQEITTASEETSKIIKTIDEIAFQTNLLALNAAVEAARAGEAGAGFAVVANEVRNLATRAAEAAQNTAELIEGTVGRVSAGAKLVEKTNDNFQEIVESASKVASLVYEIAAASKEQSTGIDQVNKAVAEMDKVVQENASNSEESASASEEMSGQAEQLKGLVGELVALVGGGSGGVRKENRRTKVKGSSETGRLHGLLLAGSPANPGIRPETRQKKENPEDLVPMDKDDFEDF